MTTNELDVLEIGPPYSYGDLVEAVRRGVIIRGRVVECVGYLYYRIINDVGPDFWVSMSQIIGLVP